MILNLGRIVLCFLKVQHHFRQDILQTGGKRRSNKYSNSTDNDPKLIYHSVKFVARANAKPSKLNFASLAEHSARPPITGRMDIFTKRLVFSPENKGHEREFH
jgi:hypothetical protein